MPQSNKERSRIVMAQIQMLINLKNEYLHRSRFRFFLCHALFYLFKFVIQFRGISSSGQLKPSRKARWLERSDKRGSRTGGRNRNREMSPFEETETM
jgi:hypothetical protein